MRIMEGEGGEGGVMRIEWKSEAHLSTANISN